MQKGQLLNNMIVLATVAHAGQVDKAGEPYILHPLTVMYFLGPEADEELRSGAVLHDVIEDTKTTYEDLKNAGATERVQKIVRNVTKLPGQTYEEYKAQVMQDEDSMKVKLADLKHNSDITRLKGVTEKDIARMAKYHKFYLEIQTKLKNIS